MNPVIPAILIYATVPGNYSPCMVELLMLKSKRNSLSKPISAMLNWLILIYSLVEEINKKSQARIKIKFKNSKDLMLITTFSRYCIWFIIRLISTSKATLYYNIFFLGKFPRLVIIKNFFLVNTNIRNKIC